MLEERNSFPADWTGDGGDSRDGARDGEAHVCIPDLCGSRQRWWLAGMDFLGRPIGARGLTII